MRISVTATLLLLAAVSCLAQPFTTSTVDVVLEGCAAQPAAITVVPNGNETKSFPVERIGPNHWRAELPRTFDARGQNASLRLGGARTGCEMSREMRDPRDSDRWIAVFTFHCTQERIWRELRIETKPAVTLAYARELQSSHCVDLRAANDFGVITIADIAADRESIFINLGGKLPLPAYTDYSMAIVNGAFGKHALEQAPLVVKRKEVLDDLMLRRPNSGGAGPTTSGNARTLRGLDLGNFDQMTLTVK